MDHAIQDAAPPQRARLARRIGWALAWLVLGILCIDFLLAVYGKYRDVEPGAYAMFWSRRGWLWTHLAGGMLAIVLGALQFLTRWPRPYPRVHRWTGRVYVVALLIASAGATGLIATSPAPLGIRAAFAATALAWLTTALVALVAIRCGRVSSHQHWMVRNYLVTLSPITFRLLLQAQIAMELAPSPAMIATLLWLSWSLPLLVHEGVCRLVALMRASPAQPAPLAAPIRPRIDPGSVEARLRH